MRKRCDKAWGVDDTESMSIFFAKGFKLLEVNEIYGVYGKFSGSTCPVTSKLTTWLEQMPLEVLNARVYRGDAVWVDTTHNATKYLLKTGPKSVVDWDGHIAPSGMFQVEEEEIGSCKRCLKGLELDKPLATCAADGGSAWPEIVKSFHQCHAEDIFHNAKNADKKYNFIQISCLKCINHYIQYK